MSEFAGTLFDHTVFDGEREKWSSLTAKTLAVAPRMKFGVDEPPVAHGVYFLYMRERMIYLGKSSGDSVSKSNSIYSRLTAHWEKVQNRVGLYPDLMWYQAIPIDVIYSGNIIQIEQYAIQTYKPYLNRTGFGSAPPGHGRRFQGDSKFNQMHPPIERLDVYVPPAMPVTYRRPAPVGNSCYA